MPAVCKESVHSDSWFLRCKDLFALTTALASAAWLSWY